MWTKKLTVEQVLEIKKVLMGPYFWGMHQKLADKYSVTRETIERIKYGNTWKNVHVKEKCTETCPCPCHNLPRAQRPLGCRWCSK